MKPPFEQPSPSAKVLLENGHVGRALNAAVATNDSEILSRIASLYLSRGMLEDALAICRLSKTSPSITDLLLCAGECEAQGSLRRALDSSKLAISILLGKEDIHLTE